MEVGGAMGQMMYGLSDANSKEQIQKLRAEANRYKLLYQGERASADDALQAKLGKPPKSPAQNGYDNSGQPAYGDPYLRYYANGKEAYGKPGDVVNAYERVPYTTVPQADAQGRPLNGYDQEWNPTYGTPGHRGT